MPAREGTSNSILVAHDGSSAAMAAAEVAIQIAQSQNLSIRGLNVVEGVLVLNMYANYHAELGRSEEPTSRAELITWFEEQGDLTLRGLEARCRSVNVPVTTQILFGSVSALIRQEAAQGQMLALGRRGHRHGADPGHLGSNFRAVAHHTNRPLLVGGEPAPRQLRRLLLAYDGSEHTQKALNWTARLQCALSAEVVALFVEENDGTHLSGQRVKEIPQQLVKSNLAEYRFLNRKGQPATEIATAAVENEVDLIVMGVYRHTFLMEWLVDSTLDRVLRNTSLPLLIT